MSASLARRLADLAPDQRQQLLADMPPAELAALEYAWSFWARPDQLPPPGDWRTWLLLGGRGSGKTRSASEWVRGEAETGRRRQIGIIGPTADAVRRIQIEGPSGLMACAPPWSRPSYEPSTRRVVWPNGTVAHLFSAEEPDRLRGPNLDAAWCDELTSWANMSDTWDMLSMALRLAGPEGHTPQVLITSTPKPSKLLKQIIASASTVVTRARTRDNAANLDASTLAYLQEKYGGSTLGRQELDAELLEDAEGALWSRALIDASRVGRGALPRDFQRIVVAIDPAGSSKETSDETGIIVAGRTYEGEVYILEDHSGKYTPEAWARRAIDAYRGCEADLIVAEGNFGGNMIIATIRAVDPAVPVRLVHASRGKAIRAEPIVAQYEQRRVHHAGEFAVLEDQMCQWDPTGRDGSPDRLDAMVWAVTELTQGAGRVRYSFG